MFPRMTNGRASVAIIALLAIAVAASGAWHFGLTSKPELGGAAHADTTTSDPKTASPRDKDSVELSDSQLDSVKVVPLEERDFPVEKVAIGSIDFDEDIAVQVFTPYQGRIIALFASLGDEVKKGQTLFTIDSPDLLQAESTLIAAAGVLELTTRNLTRLTELHKTLAVSQRDVDQATSDHQTAEGNLRAARELGPFIRQDRGRHRPHYRQSHGRPDAGRAEPDYRPDHGAQCGAGAVRAARKCASAFYCRRYRSHVDAGAGSGSG